MLDADTCIAIIRKNPVALKKLRGKSIGQVGLSSINLGELAYGADKSSRPKDAHGALSEFLLGLEIAMIMPRCVTGKCGTRWRVRGNRLDHSTRLSGATLTHWM